MITVILTAPDGSTQKLAVNYAMPTSAPPMPSAPDITSWQAQACPSSIDGTGATDVTAALQQWLAALPANCRAMFDSSQKYRVDGTLNIAQKTGLALVGGSFFTDVATTSRTRSFCNISGSSNSVFSGVTWRGPNAQGGTSEAAYVAALEAQHFVNVVGASTKVFIQDCTASMIYGDFIYVGGGASYVVGTRNNFHNNGRQCFSVCDGNHVWLVGNTVDQLRRAFVDLEPATNDWHVDTVVIDSNIVGAHRLLALAAGSGLGTVDNIWFTNNSGAGGGDIVVHGAPYNNWTFKGNRMAGWGGPAGGAAWGFSKVNGLYVADNIQPLQAGRGDWFCKLSGCTDYAFENNQYPNAVGEYTVVS